MSQYLLSKRRHITIALAGLTAAGALLTTAACSNSATPPSAASASPAPPAAAGKHHHAKGVTGKITAKNGTTWTVVNAKGKQYTVNVTPQTAFGTKDTPSAETQFTVGSNIRATGPVSDGTVTATRITQHEAKVGSTPAAGTAPAAG
jgi:hypothetical protein